VVSDPTVMSGAGGSEHAHLGRHHSELPQSRLLAPEIFRDYPSLPVDGIDAVSRWAEVTYGPEWKSMAK
jgi:hypothetical protein